MKRMLSITLFAALLAPVSAVYGQQPSVAPTSEMSISGPFLRVTNLERSLKFYVDGLGLTIARRLPGNNVGAVLVAAGTAPPPFIILTQSEPSKAVDQGNGLSRIMLTVPDPAQLAARLKAAGFEPTALSQSRIFFVRDPDGYNYEIAPRQGHK